MVGHCLTNNGVAHHLRFSNGGGDFGGDVHPVCDDGRSQKLNQFFLVPLRRQHLPSPPF
jgi:hypothetical protein